MTCKHCGYDNEQYAGVCANCGRNLSEIGIVKKEQKNWVGIVCGSLLLAALAVFVAVRFFPGETEQPENEEVFVQNTEETQNQIAEILAPAETYVQPEQERDWRDNVLMKDRAKGVISSDDHLQAIGMLPVFGNDNLKRGLVSRVVFQDSFDEVQGDYWDVSAAGDGSVLAWTLPAGRDVYALYLAAEGGINGRLACEDLFYGYTYLDEIHFDGNFHTEEAEDMSRMFYGCKRLTKLDLTDIRTDSATDISEMFANCLSLTKVDLSSFYPFLVENASGMFENCGNLEMLDLSNFDMPNVRDVSYMFYQCPAGSGVLFPRDQFLFSQVNRYDNFMDAGVRFRGGPWEEFFRGGDSAATVTEPSVSVGDTVTYGSYEQDDYYGNGEEPVLWKVLAVESNKALLLSCDALDSQPYFHYNAFVTWENCSMRGWLNGEFMDRAFTQEEQAGIQVTTVDNSRSQGNPNWQTESGRDTQDKVFLLSYAEVCTYMADEQDRICAPTPYAESMGADIRIIDEETGTGAGFWWLRSPGEVENHACFVNFGGKMYSNMVNNGYLSVRPAMWVSLDAL